MPSPRGVLEGSTPGYPFGSCRCAEPGCCCCHAEPGPPADRIFLGAACPAGGARDDRADAETPTAAHRRLRERGAPAKDVKLRPATVGLHKGARVGCSPKVGLMAIKGPNMFTFLEVTS